ncbi:PREDICTED: uncharacterized protein LOC105556118, partial [Vollenhovia emeryi]|uniref:uncharacterized protein LOC105556118 n=1 Tax=Vollenhovia emeryi TaxID=411798 RepID=UPI0005F54C0A
MIRPRRKVIMVSRTSLQTVHNLKIKKFHYLKAALEGGAAQIIKSLEFTAVNYAVAWNTICDRFNNKRLLTHNHIKALFSISPIKKESSNQIREVVDNLNKHLRALNALDQATESWDSLLIYLISTKLDSITARAWEKERAGNDIPTLQEFKSFLNSRADLLEALELKDKNVHEHRQADRSKVKSLFIQGQRCAVCKDTHKLSNCPKFLELSPQKRAEYVRSSKLCFNCMKPGHYLKDCKAGSCKQCSAKHNTLLHFNKPSIAQANTLDETKSSSILCSHNQSNSQTVLLATALILATDSLGRKHNIRAILDPGSQSSLITAKLCRSLSLQTSRIHMTVDAINGLSSKIEHKCNVEVSTHHNNYKFHLECLVIPEITGHLPTQNIGFPRGEIPANIKLADPSFHIPGKVDILIGADWFWNLLCIGQLTIGANQLTLQKTKLGWVAVGPLKDVYTNSIRCNLSRSDNLDEQLTKFWEIEELGNNKILSQEETECEKHFVENIRRDQDGRFVVTIPFKGDPGELGESKTIACKRLISLERRLERNPDLKGSYTKFLSEYERLGHMSKVFEEAEPEISYYLPHHCVIKSDSSTSGLRVVFDASSATDNGISLNKLQMVGPTVQEDLFSILIRFRIHPYILSADIEKMYRQVLVNPNQRALQRILWRPSNIDTIQTFELKTLTYGTASAPYLATRCLIQLANEVQPQLPEVAEVIRKDFYVDDLLTGTSTVEEAIRLRHEITRILGAAGFQLRKWASNDPAIIQDVPVKERNLNSIDFRSDGTTKTLGAVWKALSDSLTFTVKERSQVKVTKRQILMETAQIFDPLGLLSPCIVVAKVLLQQLWLQKLAWDESLPLELHNKWMSFRRQSQLLNQIKVSRYILGDKCMDIQLHGFADASQTAYGACIYIRSQNPEGVPQ